MFKFSEVVTFTANKLKLAVCKLAFTFTSTEGGINVSRFRPHAEIHKACPLNVPSWPVGVLRNFISLFGIIKEIIF